MNYVGLSWIEDRTQPRYIGSLALTDHSQEQTEIAPLAQTTDQKNMLCL